MQPDILIGNDSAPAVRQKFPRIACQINTVPVTLLCVLRIFTHRPRGVQKPRNPKRISVFMPEIDTKLALRENLTTHHTVKCLKCPDYQWPNEAHDQCIEKEVEFLSYGEPLGLTLSFSSAFLMFLTTSVLCVFIRYRDTPIVKANNRDLSYFLLISLMLCFLCSFIFIGRPKKLTCMLRQTAFGIVFSISVSSVLAKSIIVVIAFKAIHPNSSASKWLGSKTPFGIVFFSLLVQMVICSVWAKKSPPFPYLNLKSYNEKIIFECKEGDTIFFYCMLGYMGLLATVSFILAFLSRNLPGTFNDAKLITFSMLVFVSVWISFIPAYRSTRGKYMVAVEVFAILCSSAGLLGCIFVPKCYIILVNPETNTSSWLPKGN
ncbi:vomeronasal type-2 receptor 26-like, partial [Pleurodeles waltl]|uniref:vomeronasal type-2 receptor 26-like n=1 Tax=Pleurodeles waltl TaxID=8319 RepID=UPI003709911F